MSAIVESVSVFLLIAATPITIHFYVALGHILPAPIKTSVQWLDRFYNGYPWLPSVASGLLGAFAMTLARGHQALLFALLIAAGFFFLMDTIGIALSLSEYVRRKDG